MSDFLKGYRTRIFAVIVAVWGVVQTFDWSTVVTDRKTIGIITIVIGIATAVLREMTTGPAGKIE